MAGETRVQGAAPESIRLDTLLKGDETGRFLDQFVLPDAARADLESRTPGVKLPKTREDVLRDVKGIWQEKGFLSPSELRAELMQKYLPNSDPKLLEFIKDVELSRNKPEVTTGYMNKEHAYSATGLAHLFAEMDGRPMAMVEVDFSNMGGTNDKFRAMIAAERGVPISSVPKSEGEKLTDRAVRLLSDSMASDLTRELPPGAKLVQLRTGGDEVRLIFTGVDDPKELKRLQNVLHASIEKHVAAMGLQDHPHLKDPYNPERNGFGAAVTVQDMRKIEDPKKLIQVLDYDISEKKTELGRARRGIVDEARERAVLQASIDNKTLVVPEGMTREAFVDARIEQTKADAKAVSQALRNTNPMHNKDLKQGVAGFNEYVDTATRTMAESQIVSRPLPQVLDGKPPAGDARPAHLPPMAPINERQIAVAEDHFRRNNVNLSEGERVLLGQSITGLTSIDPSAQVRMPKEIAAAAEVYAAEAKEVQQQFKPSDPETQRMLRQAGLTSIADIKPQAMAVSFHGLASFNSVLGHENADYALRDMSTGIIEGALKGLGIDSPKGMPKPYEIAHHGGGNFSVLIKPVVTGPDGKQMIISPAKIKEIERGIMDNVKDFSKKPVAEFLESKGVPVNDNMRASLAAKGVTDFASMPDSKDRSIIRQGVEIVGRLPGVHAVIETSALNPGDNTKGSLFISEVRSRADAHMDNLRNNHIIATGKPEPLPPRPPEMVQTTRPAPQAEPVKPASVAAEGGRVKPASVTEGAPVKPATASPSPADSTVKPAPAKPAVDTPTARPSSTPAPEAPTKPVAAAAAGAAVAAGESGLVGKVNGAQQVLGSGVGMAMGTYSLYNKLGENGTAAADLKDSRTRTMAQVGLATDGLAVAADGADLLSKASRNLSTAAKVSRVAAPVGVALSIASGAIEYKIASDKGDKKRAAEAIGGTAGGIGGAVAVGTLGAKIGAGIGFGVGLLFFGVGAGPGVAIGSAVGGTLGAFLGGWKGADAGKAAAVAITGADKKPEAAKEPAKEATRVAAAPETRAAEKPAGAGRAPASNDPAYRSPSAGAVQQASENVGNGAPRVADHFKSAHSGEISTAKPAVPALSVAVQNTRPLGREM